MTTTPRKTAAAKGGAAESAAPAPDPAKGAPAGQSAAPESAGGAREPAPEPSAGSAAAKTPGGPAEADAHAEETPEAGETDTPAAPTFHWQTTAGVPGDPCRVCNPAGPPPGAGSIGCPHGQWVLAPDAER